MRLLSDAAAALGAFCAGRAERHNAAAGRWLGRARYCTAMALWLRGGRRERLADIVERVNAAAGQGWRP